MTIKRDKITHNGKGTMKFRLLKSYLTVGNS